MKKILILIGVSLSGKTTWAKEAVRWGNSIGEDGRNIINDYHQAEIISLDNIRKRIFGKWVEPKGMFNIVSSDFHRRIRLCIENVPNRSVILDNTHLRSSYIEDIRMKYGEKCLIEYKVFEMPSLFTTIRRNIRRYLDSGKWIPLKVIKRQRKDFKRLMCSGYLFEKYENII